MDWYSHPLYMKDELTKLTQQQAAVALYEAWSKYFGQPPSDKTWAILFAKTALETGRFQSMHCYNWGNIKKIHQSATRKDDGHYFTMFACGEVINGKHEMFYPPHPQTMFRAYKSAADGAADYLKLLSSKESFKKAFSALIQGDPSEYSHQLKLGNYYTADEKRYTAVVVSIFNEFMSKIDKFKLYHPVDELKSETQPYIMIDVLEGIDELIKENRIDTHEYDDRPIELSFFDKMRKLIGI